MMMEIKLEVLASTCIKQNKPWPRITWLGQEKEAVYLLDEKNINEINLFSGKTKKKIPQLCHLLKNVILLTTSRNGAWLAGILKTGELFLWNKDQDTIKIVPLADEVKKVVMATQEYSRRFHLYVSGDGNKALVTTPTVCVFLWENMECQSSPSKNPVAGQWSQIIPEASILLPSVEEKEIAMSADFIKTEMLGDICLCSFAFYSDENLMLIFLEIRWQENALTNARIHWAQQQCCLTGLAPPCEPVKSRGALLTAFSHDGLTLAVAVNQKDLQTSQILFMNTTNFVTVTGSLKGCGAKNHKISSKLVRSYWIADMTWTTDSLFLACMLKRGSLILMTCLGELLTLVTFGCSVEFGPAEFIPLHPLIMYRSQNSLLQDLNHCHDSSASEGDLMRQRFSITSHPSLPYLITSDGYIVTVLRFSDGFSPSAYMRSLLLDSAQRLEKLRHNLITSKSKEKRLPLQPLSSLRANLLQQHLKQNCSFSTIPKFLQEEKRAAEVNGESTCIQDYSDDSDDDKMFQTHSFIWGSPKAAVSSCDEGRLEFASMFDTIHAVDCPREKDDTSLELNCIQKNLIAAWRVGISSSIQERDKLLSYTIRCITHFFNILQFTKLNFVHLNNAFGNRPWMQCVLKCFQQFLTVLSWESKHRHTLGHLMKLTLQTLKLMLAEQQDGMFSSSLLGGFSLLKIVSHYLNGKNIPQYATFSTLLNINNVELDSITTPLFCSVDCNSHQSFCALDSIQKASATVNLTKNSENRLIVMWRLLYKHVLWYWAELNKKAQNSSKAIKEKLLANEGPLTGALATHIQAVLQSSGEKLEQTFRLNSVSGEEQFLVGSYQESVDAWERALQEAKAKGGKRMPFLQTRYYLAMLYCHLYHYGLTEAQGLCDRLVSELLRRTQISVRDRDDESEAGWITNNVSTEAALAVVQCLARFMAAYFTNEPLYVLPPHRVDILPPLHIRPDRCSRVIPLEHSVVTDAVRNQGLSGVWTVEYALDLLLVGGLIPEAVWLTHKLGDWKMAVSVGVAFNLYCQSNNRFSRSETVELCLPPHLTPTHIFQEKLQSFLGQAVNNGTSNQGDKSRYKQLTDPVEEESACVLFNSVEEILKAAVMAEADIVSETFLLLVNFAKELSRKLNGLVPDTLYLPAPPLYCPQPALANEEEHTDLSLTMERNCRQKVSRVIQRILLLFRAAHCSLPAAQWYIVQLKRARKIMQKIRKKVALPSLSTLPENLLNYSKDGSMFSKPTSSGDHKLDYVSCKTIASFRDLCALCWMLHVRDMLSDSCRRYQTAREKMEHQKECKRTEFDACIVECSLTALEWASRMLPFAHFMNIEELVQDIILSLIGELPPIRKVAEILVKAFPNPEDVRVPLRDKYSALQRRLQHCIVKGPSSEEMMAVVIQAVHKVNVKTLKCVIRNIGSYEKNIWEPPDEETQDPGACCYDKLSLGTSLSRSTISDLGNSQIYNDAETAESLSEALLVEETKKHIRTQMEENNKEIHHEELIRCNKTAEKLEDFSVKERRNKKENTKDITNQHVLPLVGEWEFERDDDEYIKFLDLFLTYVLERDLIDHGHSVIPFLVSFSPLLREHELNSLLFDVHTTLKRRQIRNKGQKVFRAGSCYTTIFEPSASELVLLRDKKKKESKDRTPPVTIQQTIEPSNHESVMGLHARRGLFGVSQKSRYSTHDGSSKNISLTSVLTQHSSEQASSVPQKVANHICIYKVIQTNEVTEREDPTPEMKFKFNNVASLLEWMIRWSDKRLLYDPISRQPFQECQPIMHVKISASAILASLWLLEYYFNKPGDQDICFLKLHDGSASVCSSTLESKIEDSFMDTSCSPSAGISVGIPDSHVLGKPSENAPGILQEKQHEKKESDLKGHFVTHDRMIGGTDCDVGLKKEMGEFTPSKVEVTSENEDYCEDPFAVSRSPTISVSITSVQQKKEHQSLADVQCPQEDVFVKTLEGTATKLESPPCKAIPSNVPCSVCPEMKTESTSKEITVSDNQPSFTVVSSALSSDPSGPKNEEMGAREPASQPTAQPLNISDAVREMLQDEMFKLVQLQQINFMSLMQVVGASFANLPNISQQMQQSQPFQLERSQTPNIAGTDVARSPPRHPADGFLKAQMASLENSSHVHSKNINPQGKDNLLDQQSYNGYVLNPPQTNDSSGLPENQSNEKNQIPPFQSLLHQIPARPLPLLSACLKDEKKPKLIPLAKPLNTADGLPLLKLKPQCEFQLLNVCPVTPPRAFIGPQPQRKECWGAQASFVKNPQSETTAHLNLNNYDHRAIKQAQEQTSNQVEILSKETSKQDHLDRYGKTEDISLHHFQAHLRGEKSLADNETLLQKTYEHFTPFPLLYLKPWSQSKRPSELITVKCLGKDKDFKEPCGRTALPLLYANLSPPIKFQTPKLIPLQNLIVFEQSRHIAQAPQTGHKDHPEQIQLLKADLKSLEARQDRNSKKRQKRRTERRIREKKEREKTAVTFQQDDAVDTVKQTKDNGVAFNYSFSDGDSLLNQDAVNVAELHYLASVRKRVAELQDASTNTETVLTSHQDIQTLSEDIIYETGINQPLLSVSASATGFKSHQDMQGVSEEINSEPSKNEPVTSPSASEKEPLPSGLPQTLPPDLYWNLTFPTEAAEKPLPSTSSDVVSDLIGQKYISVIDIENGGDLKNLPDVSESPPKCIPTQAVKTELPTSAKQHHTAASVTNVISPEEFEKQGNTFQTESQQVLPETGEAEIAHDPLTLCLLRKDFSINSSTELSAKKISKERLSAKLQEMDRQLLTLQNVADRMEKEFHNTKLLVETIEDIGVIADPGKDDMLFLAPGVKVTKEEHYSIHEIMENSAEGGSLECESFQAIYIDSRTPSVSPSASAATIKKSSSDINFRTEEFDESFSDPLQMTGLSGVSDIITDLIAEGGISASELGLTENQAKKISSFSGEMNKYSRKTKRDKKELQAWMKRKRKERLAEYMQTLAERRAREHSPFPLRKNMHLALSTRDFKMQQKKKEEKNKALFSEHHNHRVSEALVLMHELLSDTVELPSSDYKQMPKITSPHDFKRPHIASARSYHGSCQATRKMVAAKAGFSQTKSFSSLPSDVTQRRGQICQAPYRRMASEARSQKQWSSNKLDLQSPASHQTRKSMNQRSLPTAETATQASEESDDGAMSSWSVPDEIQQILYGSSNFNKETSQEDGCSIASLNHFDSVSESTSSILSKLDWNAVEAMVANVEEK
uniref:Ciliogenesis and planar polarity effector 1 isoform X1 n=1 Tax=Pogona vitticeps TaxID=103695 RepID=A0ABM5FU50_9SAUR